ncbi:MAG: cysteine hydrolase [Planctomycetes bacterium]|nr:cysteine hydrolase [Planctomycetota bacterium]
MNELFCRRGFCRRIACSGLAAATGGYGLQAVQLGFVVAAEVDARVPNRPKVPGQLKLRMRSRRDEPAGSGQVKVVEKTELWNVAETAIIVCDMWADHPCRLAAQRVSVMAPRMNRVLTAARSRGVMIIHAPSGGMKYYETTPFRKRMQQARPAKPPIPLKSWCHRDPKREPELPVDASDGGCDDPVPRDHPDFDRRQHPAIQIVGYDGVSDSGVEIYNFLIQEGVKNVAIMGVHTNMCVLGRPFGIRQLVYLGFNVVLVRDLTDAMYDPRDPPYVSHARGTEMVIEHIERYWCPSILSVDLMHVVPGSDRPGFPKSDKPREPQRREEKVS